MRKVVFDIETQNVFEDVGKNDPSLLDISVVGIYDSLTETYRSFLQEEFKELWPILEHTDLLIGFNSDHFDIPLLNKYYPGDLRKIKSLDILREVKNVTGKRYSLGNLTNATLGYGKTGHGLEAIVWWKNGEIEKIKKYCLDDVRITKDLYDHMRNENAFKYREGPNLYSAKIDTELWEEIAPKVVTHTLGF